MKRLIVMGVSGAGKTTLGTALAAALGWRFLDADDFHTPQAKAKIAGGQILDETDRAGWLASILPALDSADSPAVLACSALKASHRESLKPDYLVHLVITPAEAVARLSTRTGHFAGPEIAPSQFATLEPPQNAIKVPAEWATPQQVAHVLAAMDDAA